MPRTACRNSGLAGSRSILRRRRLICTSTARSLTVPPPVSAARGTVSPGADGENAQHLALAVGQMDDLLALAQFAALEMKDVRPERDLLQRLHRRRRGALEDIADPQHQFARLERLGDIIVGADLQALDPGLRLVARRQHDDRHRGRGADEAREIEAGFAGHHDVEDQQIEMQAEQLGAGVAGARRRGDAIAFAGQKARQQIADAAVVVDQQQMRRVVGRLRRRARGSCGDGCSLRHGHSLGFLRAGAEDRLQHLVGIVAIDHRAQELADRRRRRSGSISRSARVMRSVCRPASLATSASPLGVA